MITLSVHVTEIEKNDTDIYCFDNLSAIMIKAMSDLNLYGHKLVYITDYYGHDEIKLKEAIETAIKNYKEVRNDSEDSLIVISIEPSAIDFPELDNQSEESLEKIGDVIIRDSTIVEQLGFKHLSVECDTIPYIYQNIIGMQIMKYLDIFWEEDENDK